MASLNEVYIKKETLKTLLDVLNQKGEKGVSVTISINDKATTKVFGDGKVSYTNVVVNVSQTKEQRDAKKPPFNVGYGKTFWENGSVVKWEEKQPLEQPKPQPPVEQPKQDENDDLPF